ncbi:MAG: hypothetical protein AAF197_11570, partial [Pseudomonadota bacterium]
MINMVSANADQQSAQQSNSTGNIWRRLRTVDKALLIVLIPLWLVSLFLHIELAIDDDLVRPAILFADATGPEAYPVINEILPEAEVLVAERGIRFGDEILSVNGHSMQGLSGFRAGLKATSQLGQNQEIVAEFRNGESTYIGEYPFNDFGIPRWWPSLFAISFGIVGFFVLLSAPRSRTAQAIFPAFIFFSLSWVVVLGHSEAQTIFGTVLFALSMVFAGPLLLRLILVLPENTAIKSRWAHASVWFFSLMVISGLSAFAGRPFSTQSGQTMHAAFMALFYVSILAILARNYIRADKIGRRQLRWVMLGFYLAFVPAMIVTAIVIIRPDQFSLYALSSVGMPIIPIMFLVA